MNFHIVVIFVISVLLGGCNVEKYLPKEQDLYKGAAISSGKVKIPGNIRDELEGTLGPKSNSNIFGMYPKLAIYNSMDHTKEPKGFIGKMKKKYAEAPVLLSQVAIEDNKKRLANILFARGYLQPEVKHSVRTKDRKATITYELNPGQRYTIRNLFYPDDTTVISHMIRKDSINTKITRGRYFDFDMLKDERNRIDNHLKDSGFYFFIPEYLIYKADSLHQGTTDLYLSYVKEMPDNAKHQWLIKSVSIYGNYTLEKDSIIRKQEGKKTREFVVVDKQERYRDDLYKRTVLIREGQLYNKSLQNLTIERLMNLQNFRFVRSVYFPDTSGKKELASHIFLTPAKKRSMRFEISGESKSNNFLGTALSIKYKNLNLFRGAEILEATIGGGYDFQVGGKQQNASAYSVNGDVSLFVPKLLPVFTIKTRKNPVVPRTFFSLGAEYIRRPEQYTLRSLKFATGYYWKLGKSIEHNLRVLQINSISPSDITPYFDSILNQDPTLKASFEKQLVVGPRYQFIYNTTHRANRRFNYIADLQVGSSGNLLTRLLPADVDTPGAKQIGGVPVSQFLRGQADLRGYLHLSEKLTWVNRLIIGGVYSYGNSVIAPYNEQFAIGGSSSIRAFRLRTLGPGSYYSPEAVFQANEAGEFKLEMNSEWRYHVWKYLNLAVFADAGNIWYFKDAPGKPGSGINGVFSEMAMGGGIGVRLDFSIMALRFDLSFPLRKPWYPEGERWVLDEFNFGNKTWRNDNMILNIGIGYPF
jgi:outer membrane protein assembly factor BamA